MQGTSSILVQRMRAASAVQSGAALLLCVLVTGTWVLAPDQLSEPFRVTRPLASGLLALVAAAAVLRRWPPHPAGLILSRSLLGLTGAIGLLCLLDFVTPLNVGRLLHDAFFPGLRLPDPRMAPPTCLSLVALSAGFILLGARPPGRSCPGQLLCGIALVLSFLALIGHGYGVDRLYQVGNHPSMGVLTAMAVFLLALAGITADPHREPVALFARDNLGGFVARRLVPAAVAFPVFGGWMRLWGQAAGFYSTEAGTAFFAIANALFFAWLISSVARRLERIDRERATVVAALHEREERLALVTKATTDAFWDWDLRTHQRWWSDSVTVIFGYGRDTVTNDLQWWTDRIHPDDRERVLAGMYAVIDGGGTEWVEEYRYRRAGGDYATVRDHGFVVRDATGQPLRMAGGVVDVTHYRRAEAATAASEALLAAVLEAMPAAVFISDRSGKLLRTNAWAERVWGSPLPKPGSIDEYGRYHGWSRETGKSLAPEDWAIARALRERRPTQGEVIEIERFGDHEHRFLFNSAAPVLDPAGSVIGAVSASIDVTDRERAIEALRLAQDQLRRHAEELEHLVAVRTAKLTESVQELERFSYSLSHDLRAPLRAMKGFSQMLQAEFSDRLGETGAMYVSRISAAAGRLDQLIRDVLTYSRIVREEVSLQRVDVEALVVQLVDENPVLQEPQSSVTVRSPLLPVLGHDAYLTQVLSNLLYNAVKFVQRGEKPVVELWTESVDGGVRIFVRDHGIGIPKDVQHRLFGMFERLNRDYEGTGIGLSIVRKAVERMGGSLGVESEEGRGATFWVQLQKGES